MLAGDAFSELIEQEVSKLFIFALDFKIGALTKCQSFIQILHEQYAEQVFNLAEEMLS